MKYYENYKHSEITGEIIEAFYTVYNTLAYGFLEKVYENALAIELRKKGKLVEKQKKIVVYYEQEQVGEYYADLVVDNAIIVEIKANEGLCEEHEYQLINYLKATEAEVGLLLNFGKSPEFRRKIFSNQFKQ